MKIALLWKCAVFMHSVIPNSLPLMDCSLLGSSVHVDSPDKNTDMGCHALLQGIFPIQGSNPVSHIAGGFFPVWSTREAQEYQDG